MIKSLASLKSVRLAEVVTKTTELIEAGFVYNNKVFSLSLETQIQLIGLFSIRNDPNLVYPIKWNTIDDSDYEFINNSAGVTYYYLTAVSKYRAHIDSGTALKDLIRAAVDVNALNAIIDDR
jgi:hypothetical protein